MSAMFSWKARRVPKDGELRVVRKFLWRPRRINNEWRWLGCEQITQKYCRGVNMGWWVDRWWWS
jgi:hypothetical protein